MARGRNVAERGVSRGEQDEFALRRSSVGAATFRTARSSERVERDELGPTLCLQQLGAAALPEAHGHRRKSSV